MRLSRVAALLAEAHAHKSQVPVTTHFSTRIRQRTGSGFIQYQVGNNVYAHDPDGNSYSSNSITDPNGNSITWSSTGWTDTFGRNIPGTTSGPGTNEFPNATSGLSGNVYPDLTPGTPLSSVPSQCPSGTSAARSWTVP